MNITIGDQKFVLKDKITGRDFISQQPPEIGDHMTMILNLAFVDKTQVAKALDLEFIAFMDFTEKLNKHFGLDAQNFLETK